MSELKTLRELAKTRKEEGEWHINVEDLRQEAIKWIKREPDPAKDADIKAWIKHFFNITDEELKDKS